MAANEATISQIYHVVLPLLLRAGQILTARQKELVGLTAKARHEKGQTIEEEIKSFLSNTLIQLFPKHSVYDPAKPVTGEASAWQWIVAPLDGRRYYFRGLPLFTISLALKHEGEVMLGIIIEPSTQAVFHALKSEGAFMNDRSIRVSEEKDLANACIYLASSSFTRPSNEANLRQRFAKEGCRIHDFGVSTLGLCYLASGVFDTFIGFQEAGALPGLAAALLIAREAGAAVSDGEGRALRAKSESNIIAVTVAGIKKQCLDVLQRR
ncbi:hypothetical protein A3I40_04250 [Candidatus Uhrbacteria bacterium RIFCSPLOWO2_02_FULL_48_12]|uniref:Inositol monophosphatase n=1 Tax=Candidatus Uhrbacteria bacterium RIFCSPLOWO2_02_FULL_48_12 TaxID=1802407 RepID=A0A1F7V9S4_9BACT|nr:MAG: hypothetical protein A3I40_04250 [Candidatus Uhrbacteria bacterium RIFCSPLOWO2_02_FULL_48_12]